MVYQIIEEVGEIKKAKKILDEKIEETFNDMVKLSFGNKTDEELFKEKHYTKQIRYFGELRLFIKKELWNNNRYLYSLNLNTPTNKIYSSDAEINIPLKCKHIIQGRFAKKENEIFWCHRGSFNIKDKITNKIDFFENKNKKMVQSAIEKNQQNKIIIVTSLESETFTEDLAKFVKLVLELKEKYEVKI